ncbi:MAG: hypothetical protein AMXMBFR13_27860 [Phycisphaerae bacterium]
MGQSDTPPAKSKPPGAAARLAAAERVCEMLHDQTDGSRRYRASVEEAYIWSKRRMEAQRDVENARGGDRVAALQAHLQRMRDLEAQYAGFFKDRAASRLELESTHFYVAEAEELLARERAK